MTSKEEYKGHVRALLVIWIQMLQQYQARAQPAADGVIAKVIDGMKLEKEGKEVVEDLLK